MKTYHSITTSMIVLVLVLVLEACDNKNPSRFDTPIPTMLLEEAYQQQSITLLQQFFAEWNALTVSKTDAQLRSESELIQDVYAIFRAFYDPFNLSTVSGSSWNESLYTGTSYIIVQASVSVQTEGSAVTSIVEDFKPSLDGLNAQVVYLTEEYRQMLCDFLERAATRSERAARVTFLNMLTTIVPGHGTLWHFCAQPQVASITFSPDHSQATVAFRILYRGGEAVFHKEGDTWTMAHSRLLWIE